MANARGQYGTSRVGQDSDRRAADTVRDVARVITLRPEVFYDPTAFDLSKQPKVDIGTGGATILLVALGAIVAIGVVGAKKGMRLM